jgi:hypothetical protein
MGRLAKLAGLAVIARTSAIQYKKTTKTVTQIAKDLGVDFLVEGTVRWAKTPDGAGRVLVAPRVIRASDGTEVWAGRFDKPYGTDIFAIQSDIAEQVAGAMDVTLNPSDGRSYARSPTTNLAAYDAYLRAQAALDRDLFGQNWEAERQALESRSRRCGSIRASRQHTRGLAGFTGGWRTVTTSAWVPVSRSSSGWEMARSAAERAVAVDSLSGVAHGVLSRYYGGLRLIPRVRARGAGLAERSEPSSPETRRPAPGSPPGACGEALRELERAAALDPRNAERWTSIASIHQFARNLPACAGRG